MWVGKGGGGETIFNVKGRGGEGGGGGSQTGILANSTGCILQIQLFSHLTHFECGKRINFEGQLSMSSCDFNFRMGAMKKVHDINSISLLSELKLICYCFLF